MHTLTPQRLQQLLGSTQAQQLSEPARQRLMWIAEFVMSGQSISETCARLGIARSTFHRWLDRFDPEDLASLEERAHDPLTVRTSHVSAETAAKIRAYREQFPLMGKEKIRELLMSEHGLDVSSSSIGRVIERECLYFGSTPLHWRKRMNHQTRTVAYTPAVTEPEQTPAPASEPVQMQMPAPAHAEKNVTCSCAWCRFCSIFNWTFLLRSLGIASVLVNAAIVVTYVATIYWERSEHRIQAELMSRNTVQIHTDHNSSQNSSTDGR